MDMITCHKCNLVLTDKDRYYLVSRNRLNNTYTFICEYCKSIEKATEAPSPYTPYNPYPESLKPKEDNA